MSPTIIEVIHTAALAAASRAGAQLADAQDAAQDAALQALRTLSLGRPILNPRAYGNRVGFLSRSNNPKRSRAARERLIVRTMGFGFNVRDRRVSA